MHFWPIFQIVRQKGLLLLNLCQYFFHPLKKSKSRSTFKSTSINKVHRIHSHKLFELYNELWFLSWIVIILLWMSKRSTSFIIKNYFDKAGHNIQEIMKTVIAFLISSTIFGISNGQFGKAAICQFDDGMISH